MTKPKLLCVDDEPNVLVGLKGHLRKLANVLTATGGAEGLQTLSANHDVAVVISDMRMPNMDGAAFLGKVRESHPEAVRLLLTGYADLGSAVRAVNDAAIFRFLTKPLPPQDLRAAVSQALEQHSLVVAQRELLQQTLRGAVHAMVQILGLANPTVFGRGERIRARAQELAEHAGIREQWTVEMAAIFSQLGLVSLSDAAIQLLNDGVTEMPPQMRTQIQELPKAALGLLGDIPRLDAVRDLLHGLLQPEMPDEPIELGLLRAAIALETIEAQGTRPAEARRALTLERQLAPGVKEALTKSWRAWAKMELAQLRVNELRPGMVLEQDLKLVSGAVLLSRGQQVTTNLLEKLGNLRPTSIKQPIWVARAADLLTA